MLALTAYMDESGHSADPRLNFAGMAGFVAPAQHWEVFEGRWNTILKEFGLEWFHMKDFAQSVKQYEGWEESRRRKLYGALIRTICEARPIPTGAVVSIADYNSLSEGQRLAFRDPYYMAFQQCTRGASLQAFEYVNERVAMVYAYQEEFGAIKPKEAFSINQAGGAEQLWHAMKRMTDYGKWMGSYGSSTPIESSPLQAADLLAYELTKEFENLILRPNDKMRWGLRQLLPLAGPAPLFSFIDRTEMLRFAKESRFADQTGVEEVGDTFLQREFARRRMFAWVETRTNEQ